MRSWFLLACAAALAWGVGVEARAAAPRRVDPKAVDAAIRKAVGYIYSQQGGDHWEFTNHRDPVGGDHTSVKNWQWGGLSAISICALLYAGESPQKPELKRGIEWLQKADIYGIYAMGFRCQVWTMTPDSPGMRQAALRDRDLLLAAALQSGRNAGMYPYFFFEGKRGTSDDYYDHSVSQYGVLGTWAISQLGIEIPQRYWQDVERTWREHQYETGGWSYRYSENPDPNNRTTVSMTAAGLASLYITQEMLHGMEGLAGTGGNIVDIPIERALRWMNVHFAKFTENRPFYSLYGVERVGVASGRKYFGDLNWYAAGAEFLLQHQREDGSWGGEDGHRRIPDTCFGLMFLARGRAPVMMNKLEYYPVQGPGRPKPPTWNQRPRDVANIVRWTGKQIERPLNWQIVALQAPVDELHDAPILWISGRDALELNAQEIRKLRQFVEQGGLILGNADAGNRNFADGFKKLGVALFPNYEFRELPSTHPIYASQQFKRKTWRAAPFVQGLSNGARELMLLFPTADPARQWQVQSYDGPREPLAQVMTNIYLYAVDKDALRYKGVTHLVEADERITPRRTVRVARLEYPGNWDPEPGGWRRLASVMRNQNSIGLNVETVKLGTGKLDPKTWPIAHLTGTARFRLTSEQQADLRKYVESGGTLVVDAAGGVADFAQAAQKELAGVFPAAANLPILPTDHSLYTQAKLERIGYRNYARRSLGTANRPRLRGAEVGRGRVFVSDEDLSVGLVGHPVDGIYGYDPETATAMMGAIVRLAQGN